MLETMKDKLIQSQKSATISGAESSQIDVEVPAKPKRRRFKAEYKLRILNEVEAAERGEVGAILRREGLYSSQISEWRAAQRRAALGGLEKKRGRKVDPNRAAQKKITQLEHELARTQEALRKAHLILEMQGKVAGLLGLNFDHGKNS